MECRIRAVRRVHLTTSKDDRLDGWKDIADHLGREVRTCQRWTQRYGLPIYKIDADSMRGKVYAYRSELDAWLKSRGPNNISPEASAEPAAAASATTAPAVTVAAPPRSSRRSRMRIILPILILLVAAAGVTGLLRIPSLKVAGPRPEPASMALVGTSLSAFDGAGGFLWDVRLDIPQDFSRYVFGYENGGRSAAEGYASYGVDFADIDGDGRNEAAAFLMNKDPKERSVSLIDDDGDVIWRRRLDLRYIYGDTAAETDHYVRALSFHNLPGRSAPCLLVLWNVYKCAPSSFVILDGADGSLLFEYDHIGNLLFFEWADIGGRPLILLGGTNNLAGHDGALAVIDPGRLVSGLAPPYAPEPGPGGGTEEETLAPYLAEYRAGRAPRAEQVRYIRIPFSPLSRNAGMRWLFIRGAAVEGDRFYVTMDTAPATTVYYYFDSGLRPLFVKPSSDFERGYEARQRAGQTAGGMAEYLERAARAVSWWDGETWRNQ